MPLSAKTFLLTLLVFMAGAASGWSANTQVSSEKPVVNFRLPKFESDGRRAWLLRGSEARFVSREQVDVRELTFSIFDKTNEARVETMFLSPDATVFPSEEVVTGNGSIRIINDEYEASGEEWHYSEKDKKITIKKKVHVKFFKELSNFLQ